MCKCHWPLIKSTTVAFQFCIYACLTARWPSKRLKFHCRMILLKLSRLLTILWLPCSQRQKRRFQTSCCFASASTNILGYLPPSLLPSKPASLLYAWRSFILFLVKTFVTYVQKRLLKSYYKGFFLREEKASRPSTVELFYY